MLGHVRNFATHSRNFACQPYQRAAFGATGARPSQRDRTQMPPRHAPAHQQAAGHQGQAGQPQQRQSAAAASTTAQTPGAFLWKWVGCSLMALLLARTLWFLVNLPAHGAYQDGAPHLSFAQRAGFAPRQQVGLAARSKAAAQRMEAAGD